MTLSFVHSKSVAEQPYYDIDHPTLDNYLDVLRNVPNDAQQDAIRTRFGSSEVGTDAEIVIRKLGEVTASAAIHRQHYERVVTTEAGLGLSDEERNLYERFAGNPEKIAEYVCWFGKLALRHFSETPRGKFSNKIGLELGGKMQGGDWESTSDLDNMVRRLPAQSMTMPQLKGKLLEGEDRLRPSYRFMSMGVENSHNPDSFGFGIIRRRRGVADLLVNYGEDYGTDLIIKIFKESTGLVVMRELDRDSRVGIRQDVLTHPLANRLFNITTEKEKESVPIAWSNPQNGTPAALMAGKVFEDAIRGEKGKSKDIVPVSAHYVMYTERT
ncbi:MAG: hypothetical protein ABI220_03115 [Candidatus Saccharimonadales bacterium]